MSEGVDSGSTCVCYTQSLGAALWVCDQSAAVNYLCVKGQGWTESGKKVTLATTFSSVVEQQGRVAAVANSRARWLQWPTVWMRSVLDIENKRNPAVCLGKNR